MVKFQITKVLQTRGEEWALVKFRNADTDGTCAGNFGCLCHQIVAGQVYTGNLTQKRTRDGKILNRFKGKPDKRVLHQLQFALKVQGVAWKSRAVLCTTFKPIQKLFDVIEHKRWTQLTNLAGIGKSTLQKIKKAYESIHDMIGRASSLNEHFPTLARYMSNEQLEAMMKWMHKPDSDPMQNLIGFLRTDPFRIIYHCEFDSFTYQNIARGEFIKATKHTSRVKMAEAAATDLKLANSDMRRTRYKAIECIKRYITRTGNFWMSKGVFLTQFHEISSNWPIVQHENYVTLVKFSDIELFIAKEFECIRNREQPQFKLPDADVQLDDAQREAVKMACTHPLFVLQGGAGVGKTSVCQHIVESLFGNVTCAAPTGKAAQRLKEATGVEAFTVHRLYFSKTIEVKTTLLLDEQSMQDLEILARVLHAHTFHKIIFVGDTGQLTSVGPGQFFKDLCASNINKMELTRIYRAAAGSFVATNGQKIRFGDTNLDTDPSSFEVFPYENDNQLVQKAIHIAETTGARPMVLCNTNKEIANLNKELRQHFNPPSATVTSIPINLEYVSSTTSFRYTGWRFAMGDSVINVTNKYIAKEGEQTFLEVANGDIGTISRITRETITVRYRDVVVQYEGPIDYNEYLRPAYALTVNKAQGSEYDFVIVKSVSSWGDKRERFYTAVTRAKKKCIVYEVGSANNDCIRAAPATRKTFLFKRKL